MYLVTGGAGFIGSHLVDRLLGREENVVCLDDFNDSYDPAIKHRNIRTHLKHPLFKVILGDIRDASLLAGAFEQHRFTKVIHLAARVGVRASVESPELYADFNIRGTQNLLEQTRRFGAEQFIFASSSSVYGKRASIPFRESDTLCPPASPYAATKCKGERLCEEFHRASGIPTTLLRLFSVYGPRQRPDMAIHKFFRLAEQNSPIPFFGDGTSSRDYTYIDDVIEGILAALDKPFPLEVFNLGNAQTIRLSELINELQNLLCKKILINRLPLNPSDVMQTRADITKARTLLGYNPTTSIHDGLSRFARWWDQQAE